MPIVWSYGCGGNALGIKRILAFHLIEYSLGLEHKTRSNVVEAFLCHVTPLAEQVKLSRAVSKIFSLLAEGEKDEKIRVHLIYIHRGRQVHPKIVYPVKLVASKDNKSNNHCE